MKPTPDLMKIIAEGGNLDLSDVTKPATDLIQLATAAAARGVSLTISDRKPIADLVQIVRAGNGSVTVKVAPHN